MPYPWVLVNQWLIAGGGGRVVVLGAVTDWRHDVPTLAPPITLISPLSLPMVRRIVSIIPHITHPSTHPTPANPLPIQPAPLQVLVLVIPSTDPPPLHHHVGGSWWMPGGSGLLWGRR